MNKKKVLYIIVIVSGIAIMADTAAIMLLRGCCSSWVEHGKLHKTLTYLLIPFIAFFGVVVTTLAGLRISNKK